MLRAIRFNSMAARRGRLAALALLLLVNACATPDNDDIRADQVVHISLLGSNDVHGQLLPGSERGGLVTFSGYVAALRAAHISDAVLLIDAGDMWQGTLESNINEGAAVVAAYNAIGYTAATVGNHEFDFGPAGPKPIPASAADDPRGALRQRAAEADFALLAANLLDSASGKPVAWDNVAPTVIVDAAGIKVGIIGVATINALSTTIAANVSDLEMAPLADTIMAGARALRDAGAELVVVAAHAGGNCREFDDPLDLSSCDPDREIMQVARQLDPDLVDHIFAGHHHNGMAHIVNGISISSSYSGTRAFGRVDFVVDRESGRRLQRTVFAPQALCPYQVAATGDCAWQMRNDGSTIVARYEDQPVQPNPAVIEIAERAEAEAAAVKHETLGVELLAPFTLKGNPESALGNLMTDALLEEIGGDAAVLNVSGGIRAVLPAGELRYGAVYEAFPFDNQVMVLTLSGRQLRDVVAGQAVRGPRRAGFSGMRIAASCRNDQLRITMVRDDGRVILDDDTIRLVANDFLALGGDGILLPVIPAGGFEPQPGRPLVRDALVSWLRDRGTLHPEEFLGGTSPTWQIDGEIAPDCRLR